jgi:hypothetical protein
MNVEHREEEKHNEAVTLSELKLLQRIRQLANGVHFLLVFKEASELTALTVLVEKSKIEQLSK